MLKGICDMKFLDEKLSDVLNTHKIAGMAIAVTDKQRVIYQKGFGVDSIERPHIPAEADSLYRIASITKVVTGITIMKLVENGVLNLDALVKDYVPWLKLTRCEALEQMTLRHLLSHTSGLPAEYTPDGPREEGALEQSLKEELPVAQMHSLPCEGVYLYSNLGIRLASYVAEQKTGKMFSALARECVLNPLGMSQTTFDLRVASTYPLSLPHEDAPDGSLKVLHCIKENAARLGAGGLYSNTTDLCKLARLLLNKGVADNGERILAVKTMEEMFKAHSCREGENEQYGLTMLIKKYKNSYLYGHYGSAPPYALSLLVDPDREYGVVTLMNTQRDALRFNIPEIILGYLEEK